MHVAVTDDDSAVGFIAVTDPPTRAQLGLSLEFNGKPITQQRYALRGLVCIDEAVRGRGVYSAFNAATRAAYRERLDLGALFVAADNPRSLHAATTKLGAKSLAAFEVGSHRYHFLAFTF